MKKAATELIHVLTNPISMKGKLKYLLFSIISLMLIYPYLEKNVLGDTIPHALFSLVLFAGLFVVSYDNKHLIVGLILGIPAIITNWLVFSNGFMAHVFSIIFYAYTIVTILHYLVKAKHVTQDLLLGTISVYLLIGITFVAVYSLVYAFSPSSFYSASTVQSLSWSDFYYYSFSTMTTLGIGDIAPVSSAARSLSVIQVVAGQMYITIIIAKLVGIYIYQSTK